MKKEKEKRGGVSALRSCLWEIAEKVWTFVIRWQHLPTQPLYEFVFKFGSLAAFSIRRSTVAHAGNPVAFVYRNLSGC